MNAVVDALDWPRPRVARGRTEARAGARVVLLGTGTVGRAVLARLASWSGTALGERLQLVHAANSRVAVADARGVCARQVALALGIAADPDVDRIAAAKTGTLSPVASSLDDVATALAGEGTRIVIDATASEAVASQHAHWLEQGIDVVTACKLGQGTSLLRWRQIQAACRDGGTRYGDSATVGAGLPLLRSLRELQEGGDRIQSIAGVL
jgi:homoserine dehydrogenase